MAGPLRIPLVFSPSDMFSVLIENVNTNNPMVVPLLITKIQTNTDGTKVVTFGRGSPYESSTVKVRIDYCNPTQFTCKYTIFRGDVVDTNNLTSISYDIKFIPCDEGTIYKSTYQCSTTFNTNDDIPVPENVVLSDKAYQTYIVKAIEAYLIAKSKN